MKQITLTITGTSPLLMCNPRVLAYMHAYLTRCCSREWEAIVQCDHLLRELLFGRIEDKEVTR